MNGFDIRNEANKEIEIDLFGEIGDSWFSEGITMDSVKDILNSNRSKDLLINLSSLGGSTNHAFAIYDMLKMHNGRVKANIIGMTASSGTIVALGADEVNMSDNALFLVHKPMLGTHGNADELREGADLLDKVEIQAVNVYKKKTGQPSEDISALMKENRWINAEEAKDFGFIDNIIDSSDLITNQIYNKINDSNVLPKIEIMAEKTFLEKVTNFFTFSKEELTEDEKVTEIQNKIEEVATLKDQLATSAQSVLDLTAEKETLITDHATALDVSDAKVTDLEAKITAFEGEKVTAQADKDLLTAFATAIEVEAKDDENLITAIQNKVATMQTAGIKLNGVDPKLGGKDPSKMQAEAKELMDIIDKKDGNI